MNLQFPCSNCTKVFNTPEKHQRYFKGTHGTGYQSLCGFFTYKWPGKWARHQADCKDCEPVKKQKLLQKFPNACSSWLLAGIVTRNTLWSVHFCFVQHGMKSCFFVKFIFDQYSMVLKLKVLIVFIFASYSTVWNDKLFLCEVHIWSVQYGTEIKGSYCVRFCFIQHSMEWQVVSLWSSYLISTVWYWN